MIRRLLLASLVAVTAAACASTPEDPDAPEICVEVDNTRGGGALSRVFLIGVNSRQRIRIGDAPMGRTTRTCTRSATVPGSFYFFAEGGSVDRMDPAQRQNQPGGMRSPDILIEPGDLVTWNVQRNILTCQPNVAGGGEDC